MDRDLSDCKTAELTSDGDEDEDPIPLPFTMTMSPATSPVGGCACLPRRKKFR